MYKGQHHQTITKSSDILNIIIKYQQSYHRIATRSQHELTSQTVQLWLSTEYITKLASVLPLFDQFTLLIALNDFSCQIPAKYVIFMHCKLTGQTGSHGTWTQMTRLLTIWTRLTEFSYLTKSWCTVAFANKTASKAKVSRTLCCLQMTYYSDTI